MNKEDKEGSKWVSASSRLHMTRKKKERKKERKKKERRQLLVF